VLPEGRVEVCTALKLARFPLPPEEPSELAAICFESVMAVEMEPAAPAVVAGTVKKSFPVLPFWSVPDAWAALNFVAN